jgi:NAD(P)-dependent dehydrogenase (short-subunit alcohol dehydrogenase family)
MHDEPVILVTGTGRNSLGEAMVEALCAARPGVPILAIDRQPAPSLKARGNVSSMALDLNPFSPAVDYEQFADGLNAALIGMQRDLRFGGISATILSAGTYEYGPFAEMSPDQRSRLVGVNICGKIEVLHAALLMNKRLGVSNSDEFTFMEIGALHALDTPAHRSLYSATKAIGLDLCASMHRGEEVRRAIYIAPGPIDTPMLHRNHWVSKERGPVEFFDFVRAQEGSLYNDVFVECNEARFNEAVSLSQLDWASFSSLFARYRERRLEQLDSLEGILDPDDFSAHLARIVLDDVTHGSGVYVFNAPGGKIQLQRLSFSDVARR